MSSTERIGERWWSENRFLLNWTDKTLPDKKYYVQTNRKPPEIQDLHSFTYYFSSSLNRVLLLIWRSKDKATVTDDFNKNLHMLFLDFDVTDKIGVPFYILFLFFFSVLARELNFSSLGESLRIIKDYPKKHTRDFQPKARLPVT